MICRRDGRCPLWLSLGPQCKALTEKNHISQGQGQMETPLKGDGALLAVFLAERRDHQCNGEVPGLSEGQEAWF